MSSESVRLRAEAPPKTPEGSDRSSGTLLGPLDPPPVELLHVDAAHHPALLVCDHASRTVPRALADLGLERSQLERHIAWDIGAAALTRALAARLALPAVLGGYSRLVVDCNRRLDDPTSMIAFSDGAAIPANLTLSAQQRRQRALEIFEPYHAAIEQQLALATRRGAEAPALLAIHSFTERFGGVDRPWHCGVLWDRDGRLAQPLLAGLRAEADLCVGDNEPYSGRHPADYTIDTHAERRGWPHVCLEIRQDLLRTETGIRSWTERLARLLEPMLADQALYRALRLRD